MGNSLEILQKIKYKTTIGVCMLSHVRCCNTMARNPMAFNPLGSSLHGILQARILQWVAISFSRGSSWPRDRTQVSCIVGRFFTEPPGKPLFHVTAIKKYKMGRMFNNNQSNKCGLIQSIHDRKTFLLWLTILPWELNPLLTILQLCLLD